MALNARPKVLREFDRAYECIPPSPEHFLRRGSGLPLKQRVQQAKVHAVTGPPGINRPFVAGHQGINLTSQHPRLRHLASQFARMYDLGHIDMLSVRWGGVQNHVAWKVPLSQLALDHWLPVFLTGLVETQEPYRFMALHGSLDIIRELKERLADIVPALVLPLRAALETREPTRVAVACLCLSEMLHQGGCAFGAALAPHFWQLGQVLHLFMSNRMRVNLGYNSHATVELSDFVSHILGQFHAAGGPVARQMLRRFTPLYSPVTGGEAGERGGAEAGRRGALEPFTLC